MKIQLAHFGNGLQERIKISNRGWQQKSRCDTIGCFTTFLNSVHLPNRTSFLHLLSLLLELDGFRG